MNRPYHLAFLGSVDHGKSSLMGRLFLNANALYDDQKNSELEMNPALFTDGLSKEQKEGITVDVAYRTFNIQDTRLVIIDCPGHFEYLQNMVTGCSQADGVVLLVDASVGLTIQTKRHLWIAKLLGIKDFVIAINKMDLFEYKKEPFEKLKKEILELCSQMKIEKPSILPVSAISGAGVVESLLLAPLNQPTLLEQITFLSNQFNSSREDLKKKQSQLSTQVEIQRRDGQSVWAKQIQGSKENCEKLFKGLSWSMDGEHFYVPSITATCSSNIEVGAVICDENEVIQTDTFKAVYLNFAQSFNHQEESYFVRSFNQVKLKELKTLRVYHFDTLQFEEADDSNSLIKNGIYEVLIQLDKKIPVTRFRDSKFLGSFILGRDELLGAGMVLDF